MPSLGEGPFVGSGGLYSPGPATPAWPFDPTAKTAGWRSHVTLGLGRFAPVFVRCARPLEVLSLDAFADGFTRRRSLRARPPFTRPWPPFLRARLPSVFGTRTPPTDFCNCVSSTCGQPNQRLSFPRRDGGLDLLPFLTCHAFSLARAVTRGEPYYARFAPAPVPVPPVFTGLPDRDAVSNASPSMGIPTKVEW